MDQALNSFISRFGEIDRAEATSVGSLTRKGIKSSIEPALKNSAESALKGSEAALQSSLGESKSLGIDGAGIASTVMSAAPQLIQSFSGAGLQTGADSGGPGKAGGHILGGASAGAQLGEVAGPWGMAAGAVVGGVGSALAHGAAQQKYYDNLKESNMEDYKEGQNELAENYRASNGMASIKEQKSILAKQLNIIS